MKTNASKRPIIMIAIFIATFMTSVETTIVTTALPTIVSQLHGLSMQSWVFAMYLLTTSISTPIYGKLSDRVGRKPVFMIGLILFSLGSFLCGISTNIEFLIAFRAIQGLGAGAVMPITFTIIADLFSYSKRANMIAFNNTAWGMSALFGPLIGGFIVNQLSWHWIFFINVPLGIIVLFLITFTLKETPRSINATKTDYQGTLSLSGLLIFLLILFQVLGNQRVNVPVVITCLILLSVFMTWFIHAEHSADDPIIPLKLFKNHIFTLQITTALLLSGIQIGFQTYFPIWLQSIYKVSASIAGLAVTPSPIMWLVTSFFVGMLVKRYSPKQITLPIVVIMAAFYIPLSFAKVTFPMAMFYIISAVTGSGLGVIITMNTLVSQRVVPSEDVGTASSMLTLGRTLGQTIMTGLFGLVFNLSINHSLGQQHLINYKEVNSFISSSSATMKISKYMSSSIDHIIVSGMHWVFMLALIAYLVILVSDFLDKNNRVIK